MHSQRGACARDIDIERDKYKSYIVLNRTNQFYFFILFIFCFNGDIKDSIADVSRAAYC